MPFRFPLAAVLRFRQTVERRHEILLQQANREVAAARQAIDELDRTKAEAAARYARELAAGVSAAEMQFNLLCRSTLAQRRSELEKKLAGAEEIRAARRQEFQHAHQQREAVDTLRQHQLQTYTEEEQKREQRTLDDLLLMRREFLRRG